jgi:hypothetical protein
MTGTAADVFRALVAQAGGHALDSTDATTARVGDRCPGGR